MMEAFNLIMKHNNKRMITCSELLDAEDEIKALDDVLGVEILPTEKGGYKAHIRLLPGGDQVSVITQVCAIIKKYPDITSILLWRKNFPIDSSTSNRDYRAMIAIE